MCQASKLLPDLINMPFYAVRVGLTPGIYTSWAECRKHVNKIPGCVFRKFSTEAAAKEFLLYSTPQYQCRCGPELEIYTDGSCLQHVSSHGEAQAGWGLCIELVYDFHGPVVVDVDHPHFLGATCQTNNTGELSSIGMALKWLLDVDNSKRPVRILCDSQYAANIAQSLYTAKANYELVARVRNLLASVRQNRSVAFEYVRAHAGCEGNMRADQNAARGAVGGWLCWQ